MKTIRVKVLLPVLVAIVVLGGAGLYLLRDDLGTLERGFVQSLVEAKESEVLSAIGSTSARAREMASLFSRMPAVQEAYDIALSGNIDDEADPAGQEARLLLRKEMASVMAGFADASGGKSFQLHFHLPNAHSLVRMWRKQQAKRDGKWVDISDDLSSFRQTVIDVNQSGKPVEGIELGRGGFAIRGLAPVRSDEGKHLGSVEVLLEFSPILASGAAGSDESLLLYMNADKLAITTRLQDPKKNPRVGENFVLVSGTKDGVVEAQVTPELLEQGREALSVSYLDHSAMAAFPIKDYKGAQIGVMVYSVDTSSTASVISETGLTIGGVLLGILILPSLVTWLFLTRSVVRPTRRIIDKIRDIAEDRADLSEPLDDSARDEMGELARWFNTLMHKIDAMITEARTYMYMINAVPDPIFAVDDDMNLLVLNDATARFASKTREELTGTPCRNVFQTPVCGTADCPIEHCKKRDKHYEGEVIETSIDGRRAFIKPTSDTLRDASGKIIGRMEIARNVTDLVEKEESLQANLERIQAVNEEVMRASASISEYSEELSGQTDEVAHGAELQKQRAQETATAMEEMNATVLEVASNAGKAAEQADETRRQAEAGADVVNRAVAAITTVRERSEALKQNMGSLGKQAEGIGQVLNVISDIADQTNLLALNAAIEAARAGDAGRGFAVVADEVRKLAEKTMTATQEVGDAIKAIQSGARTNMASVDEAAQAVGTATELVNESGEALNSIRSLVDQSADQVRAIATAAEEQSATSEQINRSVEEVNAVAQDTADGMARAREHVERLMELARTLERVSGGDMS